MSTPDHVGTLFEGLAKNLDGSLVQVPLLDMAFHRDVSMTRAIGTHAYYQGNVLRVMAVAELMTVAASYILRRSDYIVADTEQDGFIALHRALVNAQDKLATSLSMSGISLLSLKEDETLHLSGTAAASLHNIFQYAVKGREHLNKLLELLTIWASSVQGAIDGAVTSDSDKALNVYFEEVVTAISVLRALTKRAPDASVAQPTLDNTIAVTQTVVDAAQGDVTESVEAIDLAQGVDFTMSVPPSIIDDQCQGTIEFDGIPTRVSVTDGVVDVPESLFNFSHLSATLPEGAINASSDAVTVTFCENRSGVRDFYTSWASAALGSTEEFISESGNGALSMKTPQADVDEAISWLLTNESGMIWGSALLTYFGMLDYVADQLVSSDDHNFKEHVSSKLLRGLAGKMEQASRGIEDILLSYTKKPLAEINLWDDAPAGAKSSTLSNQSKDILVDIDFEDALANLMEALADEGGNEFVGCFSKVVYSLANARDAVKMGKLLSHLEDNQRDTLVEVLEDLSLSIGRALDGLAVQFRSARLHNNGLAAS